MTNSITRHEISKRLDSGLPTILVEALPARYFEQGHLPGAINLPHDRVAALASEVLPDKQAFIVVYCASTECRNSRIAADELVRLGYEQVFEYVEGKKDWQAAGLLLETTSASAVS